MQAIYVYVLQLRLQLVGAHLVRKMCELRKVSSPRPLLLLTAYAAVWWPDVTCDIRRNMDPLSSNTLAFGDPNTSFGQ